MLFGARSDRPLSIIYYVSNIMLQTLKNHSINIPGWRTNRKIVVIESDDWGSIRMPSKEVYGKFLNKGIRVDRCPYNRNDSLASGEDLEALFNVLISFKDKNGNHPVITANTVVANPNFDKIRESSFKEYFFEPFTDTLKKNPSLNNAFDLWNQGMAEGVFHPQFHGREHVNVPLWLKLLQENHRIFRLAFDHGLWGLGPQIIKSERINIQASFDAIEKKEIQAQKKIIKDGLTLFNQIFGYNSKSFIANNFVWDNSLNIILFENRVDTFQGMKYQKIPLLNNAKRKMIRHYIGEENEFKQIYLVRNCIFEPTQYPKSDSFTSCLKDISNAFFWKKPAIITSHRLNFIGSICENNRTKNLNSLHKLISSIQSRWPDVEFMSSDKLGELIRNDIQIHHNDKLLTKQRFLS